MSKNNVTGCRAENNLPETEVRSYEQVESLNVSGVNITTRTTVYRVAAEKVVCWVSESGDYQTTSSSTYGIRIEQ